MSLLFQNLVIEPSKSADVEGSEAMSENSIDNDNYKCYTVSEIEARSSNPEDEGYIGPVSTYKDNFDVYFVVDRANYTDDTLHSYCQKILETSEKIWAVSPNVNIVLYAVNGNGYSHFDYYGIFKNAGTLKTTLDTLSQNKNVLTTKLSNGTVLREVYLSKAVDSIINKYDGKRKIYGFVFFDSANNIFQTKGDSKALLYGVKYGGKKIDISVCSNIPEKYKSVANYDEMSYAVALYKMTNGIDISAENFTNQALEHIYGEVPKENQYQYQAIIATGYQPVVLKKKLTPYDMELAEKRYDDPDYIFSEAELADCEDTDEDGLKDFEEVMFKHPIGYDGYNNEVIYSDLIEVENGKLNLPKVKNLVAQMSDFGYSQVGMDKELDKYKNELERFYDMSVLPIWSDPISVDGDGDTYLDNEDKMPLKCSLYFTQLGKSSYDELVLIPSDYDFPYLNVEYNGSETGASGYSSTGNYGGSQMWLYPNSSTYSNLMNKNGITKDEYQISYIKSLSEEEYYLFSLENGGCGITVTVDYILYIIINNNEILPVATNYLNHVEYNSYINFYKDIAKNYLSFNAKDRNRFIYKLFSERLLDFQGTSVYERKKAIIEYMKQYPQLTITLRNESLTHYSKEKIHNNIRNCLCNNIPVMLSVNVDGNSDKERALNKIIYSDYTNDYMNDAKKIE